MTDLASWLLRDEFAEAIAQAWDDGYERGRNDHCDYWSEPDGSPNHCDVSSHNPYRRHGARSESDD